MIPAQNKIRHKSLSDHSKKLPMDDFDSISSEQTTRQLLAAARRPPRPKPNRGSGSSKVTLFDGDSALAFLDCENAEDFYKTLPKIDLAKNFQVLSELGRGTFASVLLSRRRDDGKLLALKLYPGKTTELADFQRELTISYFLSPCKHVVKTWAQAFRTTHWLVLQMEPALGPDLYHVIMFHSQPRGVDEDLLKQVAKQATDALLFLHNRQLVHRDVKVENFVFADEGLTCLKLIDFGNARRLGTPARRTSTEVVPYTPPELCKISPGEFYSVSIAQDVWSFAVMLYCAAVAKFPWLRANAALDAHFKAFTHLNTTGRHHIASSASWCLLTPVFRKLLHALLDPDPAARPSLDIVHDFSNQVSVLSWEESIGL